MADARKDFTATERPCEHVLDAVYDRLSANDPFMPLTGFIDHTTMAAEALVALGQGHRLEAWASRARVRPLKASPSGIAIEPDWLGAIGQRQFLADWIAYFDRELSERPVGAVLATWVPRFAHDPGAFLFHGLIRVGHATRALAYRDTAQRRSELARGLALWAVGVKSAPPDQSLMPTPNGDAAARRPIDFARLAAGAFARHSDIRTLHMVTGPMAAQILEDAGADATRGFAHGFSRTHAQLLEDPHSAPSANSHTATIGEERLKQLSDVHDIKLVEAALRGYQASRDPVFLLAAQAI